MPFRRTSRRWAEDANRWWFRDKGEAARLARIGAIFLCGNSPEQWCENGPEAADLVATAGYGPIGRQSSGSSLKLKLKVQTCMARSVPRMAVDPGTGVSAL